MTESSKKPFYTLKRPIIKNLAQDYKTYSLKEFEKNIDIYSKINIYDVSYNLKIKSSMVEYLQTDNLQNFSRIHVERPRNFIMMYPSDDITNIWNMFIVVALFYLLMFLPISLSSGTLFEDYPVYRNLEDIVNYLFMADILVNFNVAVYDEYNNLVDDYPSVAVAYMQSWFTIDFLSSIPLDKVLIMYPQYAQNSNVNSIAKFMRLPKYFRIFKLAKQSKFIKNLEQSEVYRNLLSDYGSVLEMLIQVMKGTVLLLVACHLMSSVLMASLQYDTSYNWTQDIEGKYREDTIFRYTWAWYWAFQTVTTVGYGDNSTYNFMEIFIKICSMLIGVIVFSNFITSISSDSSSKNDNRDSEFLTKIEQLHSKYLLSGKTMLLLDQFSFKRKKFDMRKDWELVNILPEEKKTKVFQDIQSFLGRTLKWVHKLHVVIFSELFRHLEFKGYIDKETIAAEGELAQYAFIVNSGVLGTQDPMVGKYRIIEDGYSHLFYSGDIAHVENCIMYQFYHCTTTCKENSEVFLLKKSSLIKLVDRFSKHNLWDILIDMCDENLFNFYRSKYATLFVLQYLYEHGVTVAPCDINQYLESYGLNVDHSMLYNFKDYTKMFKSAGGWWNKIIPESFNFYLDYYAKQHVKHLKNNFEEALSKIKQRTGISKQPQECLIHFAKAINKKCKLKNSNLEWRDDTHNNYYDWSQYEERRVQGATKILEEVRNFENKKKDFDKAHNLKVTYWKETNCNVCDLKLLKDEYFNFIKLKEMSNNYHFLRSYMKYNKQLEGNEAQYNQQVRQYRKKLNVPTENSRRKSKAVVKSKDEITKMNKTQTSHSQRSSINGDENIPKE